MRGKYKRLTDLYVQGTEVELADGNVLWMQALNPYERDEALHDAQVARSRLVLALKDKGDEMLKVKARYAERGRDAIVEEIASTRSNAKYTEYIDDIRSDPDWTERIELLERTDLDNVASPLTEEETSLLAKMQLEYLTEINKRESDEREYQARTLARVSDDELLDAYLDLWLDQRGAAVATAEFLLTEIWYGSRVCESSKADDGHYDHTPCNGHPDRIFESKGEVRSLPEGLQAVLRDAVARLAMSVRDAKNSARQGSSSDSFPLPSEPAESTPSTPNETPSEAPGTSPSPSATD